MMSLPHRLTQQDKGPGHHCVFLWKGKTQERQQAVHDKAGWRERTSKASRKGNRSNAWEIKGPERPWLCLGLFASGVNPGPSHPVIKTALSRRGVSKRCSSLPLQTDSGNFT
jgi:hypothetical protein